MFNGHLDIIRDLDEVAEIAVNVPEVLASMLNDPDWVAYHTKIRGEGHAQQLAGITTDICTVSGGSLLCVIAPDCAFSATTVIPIGTDPYIVYKKIEEIIGRYPEASLFWDGIDSADSCSPYTEIAGLIQDTAEELNGKRPVMTPDITLSDCRYWRYRGIPAYWYGPDSFLCSAADEHVSLDEIFHVATTHVLTAVKFLLPKNGKRTKRETVCYPPLGQWIPGGNQVSSGATCGITRHSAKSLSEKELTPVVECGLDDLYATLNDYGVAVGAVGMAIYETKGSEIEVITAYPVAPEVKSGDGYEVMELPEVAYAAVAVHRGSLKNVSKTWRALRCWIGQQGRKPGVQYREIYILGDHNPEPLWITELQQSVK